MPKNETNSQDLRGRSSEELRTFVKEKAEERLKLNFQRATGQLENVARLGQVRREIARGMTIMREKELNEKKGTTRS